MTKIVLRNITKAFGATTVLDDVSLEIASGTLVALLGPSGSGKSTILKLIAGIEAPDRGDIELDAVSILPVPAHQRNAVLMFQNAYLFPFLTVAENIAFGLRTRRVAKKQIRSEVARMLDLVELPGIEQRMPDQLSGGQQQRVALARALVVQPRVLLLDEPLSNLDPAIRGTLQQVIRRIQREFKLTTILVTHDLSEAISLSDRTAVLLAGKIAAYDTPDRVFARPPTRAAARFVGVSTLLDGTLSNQTFASEIGSLQVTVVAETPRSTTFAIRPEHLRLVNAAAFNTWAGVVEQQTYHGEFVEYLVRINHYQVRVKSYANDRYRCGDMALVHFPVEHLFEIPT